MIKPIISLFRFFSYIFLLFSHDFLTKGSVSTVKASQLINARGKKLVGSQPSASMASKATQTISMHKPSTANTSPAPPSIDSSMTSIRGGCDSKIPTMASNVSKHQPQILRSSEVTNTEMTSAAEVITSPPTSAQQQKLTNNRDRTLFQRLFQR